MDPALYAVMAEFPDEHALLAAVDRCRERYPDLDAYTPFPVDGLADRLGFHRDAVALWTLVGGILGGVGVYFLQWYSAVIDYPINSGGRPLHSWPAFIPATFELTVLGAALAAFAAVLVLNGLPRLRHPVFDAPDFDLASRNRFFLVVRASNPAFEPQAVRRFLASLHPVRVTEVPA